MPPPRKKAPRKLAAVPALVEEEPLPERSERAKRTNPTGRPNAKGKDSPLAKWEERGRPLGQNKQHNLDMQVHNSGPDLPPGKMLDWLPKPEEVPPKPTIEPKMEYPGVGFMRAGHPEWQLYSTLRPDAKALSDAGASIDDYLLSREWRVRWVPPDTRRCQARAVGRTNEWMGNRCNMKAILGGRVCSAHGGNLATVKKAAQTALARAALPAAEKLIDIAIKKRGVSDADRIKAIVQILDRAGVEGRQTIEIEVAPWQAVLEKVYAAESGNAIGSEEVEGVDFELDDPEDEGEEEDG